MKIAFRVDASREMGTGHLHRCLSLAHALKSGGAEPCFVTRELGVPSLSIIEAAGQEAVKLPDPRPGFTGDPTIPHSAWAGVDGATDAADTLAALHGWEPDWVVVDSYAFGADWHDAVRSSLGCRIAAIDDVPDRDFSCDLLIDHNYADDHRRKYSGRLDPSVPLLGGPRYALLGPAFAEGPRYLFSEEVRSIGLFMGGIDLGNVSAQVLDALANAGFSGPVEIVSTSANPNLAELDEAAARRPDTRLSLDLPDLAAFFARHDLQIGAGGGATWERCCVGAPTLLLVIAENQKAVAPQLASAGIVATPGSLDRAEIARSVGALLRDSSRRRTLSERARALVDGRGAVRVACSLLASTLSVRAATVADAELMHGWRNHPATRSVSREVDEIAWEDHLAWLERTLADPERRLLVAQIGHMPVGIIRFDRLTGTEVEVSLYLDPALHGLGLGRALLLAGERSLGRDVQIIGEVLEKNVASARLFESAGYVRTAPTRYVKQVQGTLA